MIYLDYNATTPVDKRTLKAMLPYFSTFYGNAASAHPMGQFAHQEVEIARSKLAKFMHCQSEEIIFTSGATESINLAIKGVFASYASKGNHIITVNTEHRAVLDTCQAIHDTGAQISYLPVKSDGTLDLNILESAIQPNTILICIMYANNETGVLQNISAIGQIAKKHKILFFSDATQAFGKIPIDVQADGLDLLCFSAHKIYGPKGIGGLYVRRKNPRVSLTEQINGGGHERGWRSGTLNVPGIIGLAKSIELFSSKEKLAICALRDQLEEGLLAMDGTFLNGHPTSRMTHVSNICFEGINTNQLIAELSKEIAVSSGSACSAQSASTSHVLLSMGLSDTQAKQSIRFSLGRFTTKAEIDTSLELIRKKVLLLRN